MTKIRNSPNSAMQGILKNKKSLVKYQALL